MNILLITGFLFLIPASFVQALHISKDIEFIGNELKSLINLKTHDPYADLTIDEFVNVNGYTLETYNVITEDGYILTLHRIPHGRNDNSSGITKPVVVFKNGIQCSAWDFLYLGQNKSLAMLLADLGYDIWLINGRGNRYSMNHTIFNSSYNSKEFWDFSFHEKGYYDVPASIDFILNKTNVLNVTLIGHAQGTIEGLVALITRPDYQEKVNLLVLLSPVAYVANTRSLFDRLVYNFQKEIEAITKLLNIEGLPYNFLSINRPILKNLCSNKSPLQNLCLRLFEETSWGPDYDQFNKLYSSFYFANYPAGGSMKELWHLAQEIGSGEFQQYDYGDDNVIHYNSTTPPNYDISLIQTPIAAYYGKNDYVASLTDVDKFLKQVPNLVVSQLIEYDQFNHVDFIWAIDAKTMIYDNIIEHIEIYNPLS